MAFPVISILLRPGPSTWQCFRAVSYVPRKKTYYQILGLEPSATIDEIKHAFVSETRKLHPDSAKDICPAINRTEQLMALKEAYDFLRKPEQKAEYDRELEFSRKVSREMFYENPYEDDSPTLNLNLRGPGGTMAKGSRPPMPRASRVGHFFNPSAELERERKNDRIWLVLGGSVLALVLGNVFYVTFFMGQRAKIDRPMASAHPRMHRTTSRWLSSTVSGNFYERLGLTQSATAADIKKAFFTLSKKYHPDITGSNEAATKKFVALKEAYDTLKDDAKRRDYDSMLGGYGQPRYGQGNPFSQQYGGPFPGGGPGQWQRWSNVRRDPSNGRQFTEEDFERIWREFQRKTQDPRHWQYYQTFREQRQRTWDEFSKKRDEAWRQRAEEYAKRYPSDNMYVKAFNVNWSKINKFLLVYTGVFFVVALIQTWMASDVSEQRQYRKPHKNAYNDSNMVPPPSAPLRQYVEGSPPPPTPPPGYTVDRPFGYPDTGPRD